MVCYLCAKEKQSLGFQIKESYVCQSCEEKLVQTGVSDINYDYYIERFKDLWHELLLDENISNL